LPPVSELRSVSFAVAKAVALQAIKDGVADALDEQTLEFRIRTNVWQPFYLPYRFNPSV
jgi:malate dehydrogenase (oxaloacetate-decarboxylating)